MICIELITVIRGNAGACFDVSRDVGLHQGSMRGTGERAVAGRTEGLLEFGEQVTWRARHGGLWWNLTAKITEFEFPIYFCDEMVNGPFKYMRHEHHFVETKGVTQMKDLFQFESPFWPIGRWVDRWVLKPYMTRLLESRNRFLKHQVESPTEIS